MPVTLMRSKLFVPGSRPKLFPKAFAGEADGVSIDLEDAVEESRKAEARNAVARVSARWADRFGQDHHRPYQRLGHPALRA